MATLPSLLLLAAAAHAGPALDLRVAKGVKERGYSAVRISAVDHGDGDLGDFFDYSAPFFGAWTRFHLHSTVREVKGNATIFNISGHSVRISLPRQGARTRGLLLADPCYSSAGGFTCRWAEQFQIKQRLARVIDQFVASDELDFWGIVGDNFYESNQAGGGMTKGFFEALSLETKAKPLLSVPGNHDFWIGGSPPGRTHVDQFAYGFMQMYAQDTLASLAGKPVPFDFSVPPSAGSIPVQENFVFNHQIGDVAFFGFSGAHHRDELAPHIAGFCRWLVDASSVNTAVILGHWNADNLGCRGGMSTPEVYAAARAMPGCGNTTLLFVDGHEHCNCVHEDFPEHGFLIGANGMGGDCPRQQFGFLVLESDPDSFQGPNARVDYFEIASLSDEEGVPRDVRSQWETLQACIQQNPGRPYTGCREEHAVKWRRVPEPPTTTSTTTAAPRLGGHVPWQVVVPCTVGALALLLVLTAWRRKRRLAVAAVSGGELGSVLQPRQP